MALINDTLFKSTPLTSAGGDGKCKSMFVYNDHIVVDWVPGIAG